MKNLTRALVLVLSTTAVAGAVVPAAAHAATNVTRYTTATTNIRSAPSTGATKVASVPKGTKIVGTLSNGWIRISSPTAYTGRYVSASVLGTSAPVNATPLTGWAG